MDIIFLRWTMNASNRFRALALITAVSFSSAALAAGNAVVNVNATVTGTCLFNTDGAVSFTLDPSSAADATGAVTQPQFWCTNGTAYTITDDFGVNEAVADTAPRRMTNGADFIPYSFTYTAAGTGAGKTSPINMDIAATVVNADFVNAPAGAYSDTVTLTINP
jgi:spore coat protein U-like protein